MKNKQQQFAKRLHDAMSGLGTDDDSLIRVCVSRSEIDMVQIKLQFQKMYGQSLGQFIKVRRGVKWMWCKMGVVLNESGVKWVWCKMSLV